MAYEVTATRRRPQKFDELVGQEFVASTLMNSIKKSSDKTDELALDLVSTSADIYIKNNKDLFPKKKW